jgi:3-oxoacyl-[acyl-carrier-protein] synthase II
MDNIVITGYGVKAPNAYNNEHFKNSLLNSEFGLSYFESTLGKSVIVGKVPEEELADYSKTRYSRVIKLGLAAAKEAIEMSNIPTDGSLRVAVIFGSASGPTEEYLEIYSKTFSEDIKNYPLLGIGLMNYHSLTSAVIGELGVGTKAFTVVTGCNSSSDALYMAKLLLDTNQTDICIVGSSDAPICEPVMYGFSKLRMLETDVSIEEAGVPFSNRNKFIISEGAGVVILEKEVTSNNRKSKKLGVLLGVDTNNDGLSAFKSDKSGERLKDLVKTVVKDLKPTYINSQALGLKENDNIELSIKNDLLPDVPLTSIKGITGHAFGSTGMLQLISSLISIEHGFIPNTKTNFETKELELGIVKDIIFTKVETVCITTHGFGGNNSCILVGG